MKVKILLILVLSVTTLTAFAQDGGVRGRVVSRAGRVALDGVKVTMTPGDVTVMSDERGNFLIENVPAGEYSLQFETPEFEPLSIAVRVGSQVRDINAVVLVPDVPRQMIDDGLAYRHDYRQMPPRVEYGLTELGRQMLPIIDALADFGNYYKTAVGEK